MARVREWILVEGVTGWREAVERMGYEFGVGPRQALRYWVAAYVPLLSAEDRRARARGLRPKGRTGFAAWPSLSHFDYD